MNYERLFRWFDKKLFVHSCSAPKIYMNVCACKFIQCVKIYTNDLVLSLKIIIIQLSDPQHYILADKKNETFSKLSYLPFLWWKSAT